MFDVSTVQELTDMIHEEIRFLQELTRGMYQRFAKLIRSDYPTDELRSDVLYAGYIVLAFIDSRNVWFCTNVMSPMLSV